MWIVVVPIRIATKRRVCVCNVDGDGKCGVADFGWNMAHTESFVIFCVRGCDRKSIGLKISIEYA